MIIVSYSCLLAMTTCRSSKKRDEDGFARREKLSPMAATFEALETSRLRLVLPEPADAPRLIRYYDENRQHLAPWESIRSDEFYTEAFWLVEIGQIREEFDNGESLRLSIVDKF